MKWWILSLLLYIVIHKVWGNYKEVLVTKMSGCANFTDLPVSQSFTPVTDAAECTRLYLLSGSTFMLVRHGPGGVLECGHTSTLPKPRSCGTGGVTVYAGVHREPVCSVSSVGLYQRGGTVFCVHTTPWKLEYNATERHCSSMGGRVIELETRDDLALMESFNISDFWLGADDYHVLGEYRWKSGGLVDPDMFASGEPNKEKEHCLISHGHWGIADYPCTFAWHVVCAVVAQWT